MAGKIVHFELPAADAERAKLFWSGVFGWEFGDSAMPGMEYFMVRTGEDQGGAVYAMPDAAGTGTVVYFSLSALLGGYFFPHPSACSMACRDRPSSSFVSSRRRRLFSIQGR